MVVQPGELVAVIGEVGAGKSSLLAALLGELMPVKGSDGAVQGECAAGGMPCLAVGAVGVCLLAEGSSGKVDASKSSLLVCTPRGVDACERL
jgi:ABC-type branched-subunit amino acid transport system ATPase component